MKKTKANEVQKQFQRKRRFEAIQHYGGKCECCFEDRVEMLTIVKKGKGGKPNGQIHNWLRAKKWPKRYGVKCCNCEYAHRVYGTCPHQAERKMEEGNRVIVYEAEKARYFKLLLW